MFIAREKYIVLLLLLSVICGFAGYFYTTKLALDLIYLSKFVVIGGSSIAILITYLTLKNVSMLRSILAVFILTLDPFLYWSLQAPGYEFTLPCFLLLILSVFSAQDRSFLLSMFPIGLCLAATIFLVPNSLFLSVAICLTAAFGYGWPKAHHILSALFILLFAIGMAEFIIWVTKATPLTNLPLPLVSAMTENSFSAMATKLSTVRPSNINAALSGVGLAIFSIAIIAPLLVERLLANARNTRRLPPRLTCALWFILPVSMIVLGSILSKPALPLLGFMGARIIQLGYMIREEANTPLWPDTVLGLHSLLVSWLAIHFLDI